MYTTYKLTIAMLKILTRNRQALFFSLFMPVVLMLLLGYIDFGTQVLGGREVPYIFFLFPGLMALSIMQMSVFSTAFLFTQYKEKGVLKRLLATPMHPLQFVTANIVTRLVVAVVQAAIFILLGGLLFNIVPLGTSFTMAVVVLLGATMFLGLGFTLSGLAKTVESVPAMANIIVFPMMFLGGTFFPIGKMPVVLQYVAKVLPLTFFAGAMRDVMTAGASLVDIRGDVLGLVVWAVILIFLATITFSFQEKGA